MEIRSYLTKIAEEANMSSASLIFPDCDISIEKIKVIMIDEAPPINPDDDFLVNRLRRVIQKPH